MCSGYILWLRQSHRVTAVLDGGLRDGHMEG